LVFFFQAEDGIRDLTVTGVQTCALPILIGERDSLENLIGATFVFGMRSETEAERALSLLGLDPQDGRMRRSLLEMEAGRCLFRDHHGRVEAIQVDLAAPYLLRAFSTTPTAA